MPKIKLPGDDKSTKIVAGCLFVDGEMTVSNSELNGVANVLVRFHGCEVVADEAVQKPAATDSKASGSLAAAETKTGEVKVEVKPEVKPEVKAEVKAEAKAK